MRNLIDIMESNSAPFVLDPALNPQDYIMTDSLRDLAKWRARVHSGNSRGDKSPDVGEMDEVGYIMISLSSNRIIPMARADEHHQGFDTLRELRGVNPRDYQAVWRYGNNYIYYADEVAGWLNVLTKFLAYGGPDGVLKGSNDLRGKAMTSRQFIAARGDFTIAPGSLAPMGQGIVAAYQKLAAALAKARANEAARSVTNACFVAAHDVVKTISDIGYDAFWIAGSKDLKDLIAEIKTLKAEGDTRGLEMLFFGFNSLKNTMHNKLRKIVADTKEKKWNLDSDDATAVFGDLDLAVDLLGRF